MLLVLYMRLQIFDFEQEWTKKHNRVPKNFERGSMESVYTRYRKLKKEIRDLAAIDMQRLTRGFVVRSCMGQIKHRPRKQLLQPSAATASAAAAAAAAAAPTSAAAVVGSAGRGAKRTPGDAGSTPLSAAAAAKSGDGVSDGDLYAQYRQLLVQKRDLKRELKKFDEDFLEKNGRAPRKSDKEVIRPMYQTYHEVTPLSLFPF